MKEAHRGVEIVGDISAGIYVHVALVAEDPWALHVDVLDNDAGSVVEGLGGDAAFLQVENLVGVADTPNFRIGWALHSLNHWAILRGGSHDDIVDIDGSRLESYKVVELAAAATVYIEKKSIDI